MVGQVKLLFIYFSSKRGDKKEINLTFVKTLTRGCNKSTVKIVKFIKLF